ncbi:MAG: response regulator [Burkholderiales bacterium]
MRRIIVVDDEQFQRQVLRETLKRHFPEADYAVEAFADPVAALARARVVDVAVVIADFRMPGMNGVAFLREMRKMRPHATRLMITASSDIETAVMALNHAEVFRFIRKPWDATLNQAVKDALQRHEEVVAAERLKQGAVAAAVSAMESPEERARVGEKEPGITHVRLGPDGSVSLS